MEQRFEKFFASEAFGVVGASSNREKYGNKVLRSYVQKGRRAIPVNPKEATVEGIASVPTVKELPPEVKSISIITPPPVTDLVVAAAIEHGIKNIWMQPGAESPKAIELCEKAGVNVIGDGSCVLVIQGYHDH